MPYSIRDIAEAENVLSLPDPYTIEDVHLAYRKLIKELHPDAKDAATSDDDAARLNAAYSFMRKEIRSMKPGERRCRTTDSRNSSRTPRDQKSQPGTSFHSPNTNANPSRHYSQPAKGDYPISVNSSGWWHEYAWAASSDPAWFKGAMWIAEHLPWTLLVFLLLLLSMPANGPAQFYHGASIVLYAIIGWFARRPIHAFIERIVAFPFKLIYRQVGKR